MCYMIKHLPNKYYMKQQHNSNDTRGIISPEKISCLRWDSNPRHVLSRRVLFQLLSYVSPWVQMSDHGISQEVVPIFPGHDTGGEEEGGEGTIKIGSTERDTLAGTQVGEDDVTDKGVGEDDEEQDAHQRCRPQQSTDHSDGQVLHDTLCEWENGYTVVWAWESVSMGAGKRWYARMGLWQCRYRKNGKLVVWHYVFYIRISQEL